MPTQIKRPVGVTILALIYLWIGCGGTLFFPIIALTVGTSEISRLIAGDAIHSESVLRITGILFSSLWFLTYVAYAVLGFGLWKLRSYARTGVIALNTFFLAVAVVALPILAKPLFMGIALIVGTLPPFAWIIWYLRRPRIRYAFGVGPAPGEDPNAAPRGLSKIGIAWVVICLIATFALFLAAVFVAATTMMRSTGAYQLAIRQAQGSACVTRMLGAPIEAGWMLTGGTNESDSSGLANLSIPIHGPKGKGSLLLEAKKSDGVWAITSLILDTDSGQKQLVPENPSGGCQ